MNIKTMHYFQYDSVDSTNEEAKRLIDSGKIAHTSYVVANEQTSGKGTRGRIWVSPKGAGVYLSVVHVIASPHVTFVANAPRNDTLLTKSAGVASAEAIKEIYNIEVKLKPVNDIYAKGRKLGGILVETRLKENKLKALITGIGINVLKTERKIEDSTIQPISIEELISDKNLTKTSREMLIKKIVEKVVYWHKQVFENQLSNIENKWEMYKLPMIK